MYRTATGLILLFVLFAGSLLGQATGLIIGTVQDGSGAVVPGASVQAINELTGIAQPAETDAQGRFSFPRMPVGEYRIEVSSEGFRTFRQGRSVSPPTRAARSRQSSRSGRSLKS